MIRYRKILCAVLAFAFCIGCGALQNPAPSSEATAFPEASEPAEAQIVDDETIVLEAEETSAPTLPPTPSPAPSPTPVPTPVPTPTPEPTPEPITQERLDSGEFDRFFDGTLFLGDSLTDMFGGYVRKCRETEEGLLGSAQLFGVTSMSVKIACTDRPSSGISFRYRGKAVSITEIIRQTEAKRVFIMLGVNDIGSRSWDTVQEYFATLIDVISEKCPDTEIIIQGILPVTKRYIGEHKVSIERWNSFNAILAEICEEHGAAFLDFSKLFMDENGYLDRKLSSDNLFHLNETGEAMWIRVLRLYAAQQLYPDAEVLLPEN